MADLSEKERSVGRNLIAELEEAANILDDCEDLDLRDAVREAAAYLRSEPERLAAARNEAIEQCAAWVENYPSPLDDLPMALTIRDLATGLRNLKEPQ